MATNTRSDREITCAIQKLLDENMAVRGETESERREKRIAVVKNMFDILCSTPGKTFVHKHDKFKKVLFGKLEELHADIPGLVNKWRCEIFGSEFQIPEEEDEFEQAEEAEEAEEAEFEQEEEAEEAEFEQEEEAEEVEFEQEYDYYDDEECEQSFNAWIDKITYDAILTRSSFYFLRIVWAILKDIDNSMNDYDFQNYNLELYDTLCSKKGQLMLEGFPVFRTEIEGDAYEQELNGAREWKFWWKDVFGCEINDPRYWVH
jgi:hypothetical protein